MRNKIINICSCVVIVILILMLNTTGNIIKQANAGLTDLNTRIDNKLELIKKLGGGDSSVTEEDADMQDTGVKEVETESETTTTTTSTPIVDTQSLLEKEIRSMAVNKPFDADIDNGALPIIPDKPVPYGRLVNSRKGPHEVEGLVPGRSESDNDMSWINVMNGYVVDMSTRLLNSSDVSLNDEKAAWMESTLYELYSESSPQYDITTYREDDRYVLVDLYNEYEDFTVNMILDKERMVLYYRDIRVEESGYYFREG